MTRKTRTARATRKVAAPRTPAAKALVFAKAQARKAINAADTVRDSAAGAFDAIVKGRKAAIARMKKTRNVYVAKANEAKQAVFARADEARDRTVEAVSALERVFEQRVSRAISKLGVPTHKDVRALSRQVAQLQASVNSLRRSRARAAA